MIWIAVLLGAMVGLAAVGLGLICGLLGEIVQKMDGIFYSLNSHIAAPLMGIRDSLETDHKVKEWNDVLNSLRHLAKRPQKDVVTESISDYQIGLERRRNRVGQIYSI